MNPGDFDESRISDVRAAFQELQAELADARETAEALASVVRDNETAWEKMAERDRRWDAREREHARKLAEAKAAIADTKRDRDHIIAELREALEETERERDEATRALEDALEEAPPEASGERATWDGAFFGVALAISRRATCRRGSVGSVIVDAAGHIVATGYNGSPAGTPHCTDPGVGCHVVEGHCRRTIHAEANAIYNAQDRGLGDRLVGGTLYVTHYPCPTCATLIVRSGLSRVVAMRPYGGTVEATRGYLLQHGVIVSIARED